VDPLEILKVHEVMRTNVVAVEGEQSAYQLAKRLHTGEHLQGQNHLPVLDDSRTLLGVITRKNLVQLAREQALASQPWRLADFMTTEPVLAFPEEPLRVVVYRMAATGLTCFPVVARGSGPRELLGTISLTDLLKARALNLDAEQRRERVLPLRLRFPRRRRASLPAMADQVLAGQIDEVEAAQRPQ
jgi:CBS domain-containing protein